MKTDWSALNAELREWRRGNLPLPIWWRDDDAVTDTPALARLTVLAEDLRLPVHIAVIPDFADDTLAKAVRDHPALVPIVHGWRHENNAPNGAKKAEFGQFRPQARTELEAGLTRLSGIFDADMLPLFVPPWNRVNLEILPLLVETGYTAVSTFQPRETAMPMPGLMQINTHIDPIFWRGDRGLVAPEAMTSGIVANLRDRRHGVTDATEPLGLLTHHLVHTEDVWRFSFDLLRVLLDGGAEVADLRAALRGAQT